MYRAPTRHFREIPHFATLVLDDDVLLRRGKILRLASSLRMTILVG